MLSNSMASNMKISNLKSNFYSRPLSHYSVDTLLLYAYVTSVSDKSSDMYGTKGRFMTIRPLLTRDDEFVVFCPSNVQLPSNWKSVKEGITTCRIVICEKYPRISVDTNYFCVEGFIKK